MKDGESILEINGKDTREMAHLEAQKFIKNTGFSLNLILDKKTRKFSLPNIIEGEQMKNVRPTPHAPTPSNKSSNKRVHNTNRTVRILRSNSNDSELWYKKCVG